MYKSFAYHYDKLMKDIDYKRFADYMEEIFTAYSVKPSLVLDLGCGTGSMCVELARRGYDMIGADLSADMLSVAAEKMKAEGLEVLLLNQDMADFELFGTVDAIISLVDSVNYVTDKRDLKRFFKLVNNYLNPGGLFIFDINSPYKFRNILANNVFYSVEDDICYLWQNTFDKKSGVCEFDLTFFARQQEVQEVQEDSASPDGKDSYERFDEVHYERLYEVDELKTLLEAAELEFCAAYDAFGFSKPREKSERIFIVCRSRKNC